MTVLAGGRRALSGSKDRTLRLWDLETGAELRRFEGHWDAVTSVTVLPDGRRALSGSSDKTLRLWNLETGAELRRFEGHEALGQQCDGAGRRAACALWLLTKTLRLWDLETGDELRRFERQNGVTSVTVLADGRALSGSRIGRCGCGISRPAPSCAGSMGTRAGSPA